MGGYVAFYKIRVRSFIAVVILRSEKGPRSDLHQNLEFGGAAFRLFQPNSITRTYFRYFYSHSSCLNNFSDLPILSGCFLYDTQREVGMKCSISSILLCILLIISFSNASAADQAYHIGTGDVIEISVWKDPDLSRTLVVPPDGVISFPLIDSINISNLTVADLKKAVTQKLSEFVPDATVTVMLTEINSLKAYVIGKVNSPGEYAITLETNVMQILAQAKGLTPFASKGSIKILRQEKDKIAKIPFDYGEVEKGKNLEQNIILQPGDVVVVP